MMATAQNETKYILLVGDGMGDFPIPELDGKTPLEVAKTPNMDRIAACNIGLAVTVPKGMEPGSDTANLSLLGYDPKIHHCQRGPFEAASMGVPLEPHEVAFRMNLVTLDWKSKNDIRMISHSSGDIATEEAEQIVEDLSSSMDSPEIKIYPGVAYRHLLVWKNGPAEAETLPPHDFLGQNMAAYLNGASHDPIVDLLRGSWNLLKQHPVNEKRRSKNLPEANSIWLWGQDRAPTLPRFSEKFGMRGGVISAVDLIRGIGVYAGFKPIYVEGATGYLDTNYLGKAQGALEALNRFDFMFVHVEAPDEAGHHGSIEEKIQAIEAFDHKVVGTVLSGLDRFEDFRIMIASDHLTPIPLKTHSNQPTPFAWATKTELKRTHTGPGFSESAAKASGLFYEKGYRLMSDFLHEP